MNFNLKKPKMEISQFHHHFFQGFKYYFCYYYLPPKNDTKLTHEH